MFGFVTGGLLSHLVAVGHHTGLFEAASRGPATSAELAARAGLQERYVREWLGAMATGGVFTYDPATATFTLPPEHAVSLTGTGAANLAPVALIASLLGEHVDGVTRAFREGGGVPYEEFRPRFTGVMDALSRGLFDEHLLTGILPAAGRLAGRLADGIRVADVGCGTGHALHVLAGAYPASTFTGYDLGADAIASARTEAGELGLDNVTFEVCDVELLPTEPPFDAVFAFDAIHDQAAPAAVLRRIHDALVPGGWFVMMDIKASSDLAANLDNPLAPLLYAVSTLHCMTVSLARGGAGLGTVWGEELARTMLAEAGFTGIEVHDVPDDPMDSVYVCRRPE
ncbi:class I SAM-dependent methyltransferase [Prauserella muralis]|uniref:Transcriptional regulator n=1 Tax=Prauserella muralis TaxID=588067 RepID=A0A2V4BB22_9PSEU|nr:transcriptional regulator [Prauserella muralis]